MPAEDHHLLTGCDDIRQVPDNDHCAQALRATVDDLCECLTNRRGEAHLLTSTRPVGQ